MAEHKRKLTAGVLHFRGGTKTLLEQRNYIEYDKYGFRPIVQLSLFLDFKRDEESTITMQFDSFQFRQLVYALLAQKGKESPFKLLTGSNGNTKNLFISETDGVSFVNMSMGNKKFMASFTRVEVQAMVCSMTTAVESIESESIKMDLEKSMRIVKEPFVQKTEAKKQEQTEQMMQYLLDIKNALCSQKDPSSQSEIVYETVETP